MTRIWGAWDEEPDIDGWVWDGTDGHKRPGHEGHRSAAGSAATPCIRTQELRRAPEDRMYPTLADNNAALGQPVQAWQAD